MNFSSSLNHQEQNKPGTDVMVKSKADDPAEIGLLESSSR